MHVWFWYTNRSHQHGYAASVIEVEGIKLGVMEGDGHTLQAFWKVLKMGDFVCCNIAVSTFFRQVGE